LQFTLFFRFLVLVYHFQFNVKQAIPVDKSTTFTVAAEFIQHPSAYYHVFNHRLLAIGWLLRIPCSSLPHQHNDKRGKLSAS